MHLRRIWTKRRFCPRPNHQWVKVWTSSRMSSPLFCFSYFSSIFSVKTLRLFNNNTTLNFDVFTNFFWMPKNENYFSWMIQGLKMLTELSKDASKMSQSQNFLRKYQKFRKLFFSYFLAKNRQFCDFDQKISFWKKSIKVENSALKFLDLAIVGFLLHCYCFVHFCLVRE